MSEPEPKSPHILISGIVAGRDRMPYIQLLNENGLIAQLDMAQARSIANDIVVQCSRAEADAMLVKFFDKNEFPPEAGAALLVDFREFRHELDMTKVERFNVPPGGDE